MGRLLLMICFLTLFTPIYAAPGHQRQPDPKQGQQQQQQQQPADPQQALEVQTLGQERQKTTEEFKTVNDEVAHLEQEIVIMLGTAALVITIVFGATILGEYRIHQTVKELKGMAEEVKARFPMLAGMEEQARKALKDIERNMSGPSEWLEDRYEKLDIKDRQSILSAEHLIALEFAGPTTASQLRGMANFYASKYLAEDLASDLDRAFYYGQKALQRAKAKFQYLNDLGLIYSHLAKRDAKFAERSVESFEASRCCEPKQQRCYYNLSLSHFENAKSAAAQGDQKGANRLLEKARDLMDTGLKCENWETTKIEGLTSAVHYNLACCLCMLAKGTTTSQGQSAEFDAVVNYLKMACHFKDTKPETVKDDLDKPGGDLYALRQNQTYANDVKDVLEGFQKAWAGTN
jgi:hypothetical protein